jgi:hypothetical protein
MDADLVGFQEMKTFAGGHSGEENLQLDYLPARMPDYRPEDVEPLEQGFFFSNTPDEVYSRPWFGRFPGENRPCGRITQCRHREITA